MWADRFLNANMTGYGEWEASGNGTDPAIDLVPKDILMCDWHYTFRGDYPSIEVFSSKGFSILATTYESPEGARAFMEAGIKTKGSGMVGVVASVWSNPLQVAGSLLKDYKLSEAKAEKADQKAEVALQTLRDAWNFGN